MKGNAASPPILRKIRHERPISFEEVECLGERTTDMPEQQKLKMECVDLVVKNEN